MSQSPKAIVGLDEACGADRTALAMRIGARFVLNVSPDVPAVIERAYINGLDAGRKAEREVLALVLTTIASAHRATIERRIEPRHPGYHSGSIGLRIALNGVGANVDISNIHGGKYALIHWYNDYSDGRNTRDFSGRFRAETAAYGGGSSHKATSGGNDWNALAMSLDAGLRLAARGEAFEPSAP